MSSRLWPPLTNARKSSMQAAISSAGRRAACWRTKVMNAVHAKLIALVAGLRKAVHVKDECVAGFQLHARGGRLRLQEHPQRQTGRFNTKHAAAPNDDCRAVAGVMNS